MANTIYDDRAGVRPDADDINTQVLIVGLGPVGVVLGTLLGEAGISVLAIDRDADLYPLPRAAAFDDEIMRIFQQVGVAEEIEPDTRVNTEYEFVNAEGKRLMHFQRDRVTACGWGGSYLFHQPAVERALRRKLVAQPSVDVRLTHRLLRLERNDESGVQAVIATQDGKEIRVTARYLVGCDGGASTTRKLAGIGLFDYGFEEPWLVVDTLMNYEDGLKAHSTQYCNPQRPVTMVPMSPGRYRFEFMLLPGEQPEEMSSDASIEQLLSPFVKPGQAQLVRKAVYQFHGLVANQWRVQSLLLAGDSAHQMPPFMGQGMCSGVRDAANLAWKLTLVLQGRATSALLDSYQAEREPHVRTIIEKAIEMGRVICTIDPEAAARRDAEMLSNAKSQTQKGKLIPGLQGGLLTKTRGAGELCPQPNARLKNGSSGKLDDLLTREAWLISKDAVNVQDATALTAYQLGVDFDDDGVLERWLAELGARAVLVRPDRYVFGSGEPHALIEQWQQGLRSASSV